MHVLTTAQALRDNHPNLWKAVHHGTLLEAGREFEDVATRYPLK